MRNIDATITITDSEGRTFNLPAGAQSFDTNEGERVTLPAVCSSLTITLPTPTWRMERRLRSMVNRAAPRPPARIASTQCRRARRTAATKRQKVLRRWRRWKIAIPSPMPRGR